MAVHAFDCHGAKRAGLTTGWARRPEGYHAAVFAAVDVVGEDVVEVVEKLAALTTGGRTPLA